MNRAVLPDAHRRAFAALLLAGCGSSTTPAGVDYTIVGPQANQAIAPAFKKPALITLNLQNGALEYWPIRPAAAAIRARCRHRWEFLMATQ